MSYPDFCPKCNTDFRITYVGDDTVYYTVIGMEYSGIYDGVLSWRCDKCGHEWAVGKWAEEAFEKITALKKNT